MPTSRHVRVLREGLRNTSATLFPASGALWYSPLFISAASSRSVASSCRVKSAVLKKFLPKRVMLASDEVLSAEYQPFPVCLNGSLARHNLHPQLSTQHSALTMRVHSRTNLSPGGAT